MTSDYAYFRLSSGVLARVRQRLFDHLQTLSHSFFQKYSGGEISARYQKLLEHSPDVRAAILAQEAERSGPPVIGTSLVPFANGTGGNP